MFFRCESNSYEDTFSTRNFPPGELRLRSKRHLLALHSCQSQVQILPLRRNPPLASISKPHSFPERKSPGNSRCRGLSAHGIYCLLGMARKEGFEPSHVVWTSTPLAGEPLRPLGYFRIGRMSCAYYSLKNGGESGIRTHGCLHIAGFQDRFLKPLGHLSKSVSGAVLILPRHSRFVNG